MIDISGKGWEKEIETWHCDAPKRLSSENERRFWDKYTSSSRSIHCAET
jgi:hypothetical protein